MRKTCLFVSLASLLGCSPPPSAEPTTWIVGDVALDEVDLVIEVDDSRSTLTQQVTLSRELGDLARMLTSGDVDGDGTPEHAPIRSVHVGVITPDLGSGPAMPEWGVVEGCAAGQGDDGVLLRAPRLPECTASHPSGIVELTPESDPEASRATLRCLTELGTNGCNFEQQLEAALRALSPSSPTDFVASRYEPPTFEPPAGHTDAAGMNAGILRPHSVLGVLVSTDEDDCSVPDPAMFHPGAPGYSDPVVTRCHRRADALMPVARYTEGFLQLREHPGALVFGVLAGVPTTLERATPDAMLADPGLAYVERPTGELQASCEWSGGMALPPRRLVEVASVLAERGAHTVVGSACTTSYLPVLRRFADRLLTAARGTCLRTGAPDDLAACQAEILPAAGTCEDAGLRSLGTATDAHGATRPRCALDAWHPESASARCDGAAEVVFDTAPRRGELRLSCPEG